MAERERIVLACVDCSARNYKTTKKRGTSQGRRFEIKKYCPTCAGHTLHQETK